LSLPLYLDDCADGGPLRRVLTAEGHAVSGPEEAGLLGADDAEHFEYARRNGLALLTKNPRDFVDLHEQNQDHAGILLVYQDNDKRRDMQPADIARAISHLLASGLPIAGEVHVLNHWR
jgi:hypothetical protein